MADESTEQKTYWARYDAPLLNDYVGEGDPDMQHVFGPVNRINIFTGPNNSGKSRAMRELFLKVTNRVDQAADGNCQDLSDSFFKDLNTIKPWFGKLHLKFKRNSRFDSFFLEHCKEAYNSKLQSTSPTEDVSVQGQGIIAYLDRIEKDLLEKKRAIQGKSSGSVGANLESMKLHRWYFDNTPQILNASLDGLRLIRTAFDLKLDNIERILFFESQTVNEPKAHNEIAYLDNMISNLEKLKKVQPRNESPKNKNVYIPTLRSLYSLTNTDDLRIDEDIYEKSVMRNNFPKSEHFERERLHEIFTGQNLFWDILDAKNGKDEKWNRMEEFEQFITDQFFPGEKRCRLIAQVDKDQIRNRKGDSKGEHHVLVSINGKEI